MMEAKMDTGFTVVEAKLSTVIEKLAQRVVILEDTNQKLEATIKEHESRFLKLEHALQNLNQIRSHDSFAYETQVRLEHLENASKEKNLAIFGVNREPEETPQKLTAVVLSLIEKSTEIKLKPRRIFRPGKTSTAPVIVELEDTFARDSVLKKAKLLKGTGIAISRDYSFGTRKKRKVLNLKRLEAIKDGKKATLRDDQLIIDSEVFILNKDDETVPLITSRRRSPSNE